MNKYLDITYWFELYPSVWGRTGNIFLIISLTVLFVSFLLKVYFIYKNNNKGVVKKTLTKLSNCLLTLSVLAVIYWFMRQQLVPFFSSRFWLLIIFLTAFIWLAFIVKYFVRKRKEEKINLERTAIYGQYLPGRK